MKLSILTEQLGHKSLLNKVINTDLEKLNKLYTSNGHELRIVGGAVRDILSKKVPKDIDLASDATPDESLFLLNNAGIKVIETGLQHGTITAVMNNEPYEITTLRIDAETDGRHAKVKFTKNWEEDANRRDLTFNAMSMDFNGTLYDYHGGKIDLDSGTAKFVGKADDRIQEDFLRILRYFRFQGRTDNVNFDPDTLKSISNNSSGLKRISGERIWSEFKKIISGNNAPQILDKMTSTDTLKNVQIFNPNLKEFNKIYNHSKNPLVLMATMVNEPDELETLRNRWKFSSSEYNTIKFILNNKQNYNITNAKRDLANGINKDVISAALEYNNRLSDQKKFNDWSNPEFPISGNDLVTKGFKPGPELGKELARLKNSWIDSNYKLTKSELLGNIKS